MNVFELFAKLTLDTSEYEKKLGEVEAETKGKTSVFSTVLGKAGQVVGTSAKVIGAGVAAAAGGIATLTGAAVNNYGQYEQLVGGVETLFGNSADQVQQYADNAYKTAGLSANQYMEQATSFAAALLQSVGGDTQAAAEYADTAIRDMSDNANKMGTNIQSIQNAYQGFAKQNYTMLDNLKLGYGGTKTEMERLVTDAEKLNKDFKATRDENGKLTMSYGDIVDAIHIVQQNMGITGTTAKEAGATIQGSAGSMRAAWQNLVTGLANDNADIGGLITNLIDSVVAAADNLIPRIQQSLSGIGELITGLVPIVVQMIPEFVNEVLPPLLDAAVSLLSTIATALADNIPMITDVVIMIVTTILRLLIEHAPELLEAVGKILIAIVEVLAEYAVKLWDKVKELGKNLLNSVVENGREIIQAFLDWLKQLPEKMAYWIGYAIASFIKLLFELPSKIQSILTTALTNIVNFGKNLWTKATEIARNFVEKLISGVRDLPQKFLEIGRNIITGIWNGISAGWDWLIGKVKSLAQSLLQGAKDALGIASPSKAFAKLGLFSAEGFGIGFEKEFGKVKNAIEDDLDFSSTSPSINATGTISGGGSGYGAGNVVINIENMTVRDDNDIRRIAKQLYNMINQSARSQGIAGGVYA